MVKRGETKITVQPLASISNPLNDMKVVRKKRGGPKEEGSWRYPNGQITRATHLNIDTYYDHKDPEFKLGRRKHESNFFITINTNRDIRFEGPGADHARQACKEVLEILSSDQQLCTYLKFGPKSAHYQNDKYEDVIQSVDWKAAVETGPKHGKLHCHIWLTVHHYSQVQVNMPVMQELFRAHYNKLIANPDPKFGFVQVKALRITRKPYINVKLLPTSDWAMVIRNYIHKGMDPGGINSEDSGVANV